MTLSIYPNGECPNCGGQLFGDGVSTVLRCEFADDTPDVEPDANPVYCASVNKDYEN